MLGTSLKVKLLGAFLVCGLLPMLVVSGISYFQTSDILVSQAKQRLEAIRSIKGQSVKRYFNSIRDQVLTLASSVMIKDATENFTNSFYNYSKEINLDEKKLSHYKKSLESFYANEFGKKYKNENNSEFNTEEVIKTLSPIEVALQYHYISNNQNELGSKEILDFAEDKSKYSHYHALYHDSIRNFLNKFGYYDIFIIDNSKGHIVYSVFKELDYATSLKSGAYKDTNFARAYSEALKLTKKDEFVFVDYKKYSPSYESPASFIATPIWKGNKKIGVLVFQMPIDKINDIMTSRIGLGESGESYIFGSDKLMRSNSILDDKNYNVVSSFKNSNKGSINSFPVLEALNGKTGEVLTTNYLGDKVISSFSPISILGQKWGLVSEISQEESLESLENLKIIFISSIVLTLAVIIGLAWLLANSLSKSIIKVTSKLNELSVSIFKTNDSIIGNSENLNLSVSNQATSIQQTVSALTEISSMVEQNSVTTKKSSDISKMSKKASENGKNLMNELGVSVGDIAKSGEEIASEVAQNSKDLENIILVIGEIEEKTNVINDIVFQTKLLSFNASVEAARAGESGKGFAVVAEEVGNLATMSGNASLEIKSLLDKSIERVSTTIKNSKDNMDALISNSNKKLKDGTEKAESCKSILIDINENVHKVDEMVHAISLATEEQNVGIQEIRKAVAELDDQTHKNTTVANESLEVTQELGLLGNNLKQSIFELNEIIYGNKHEKVGSETKDEKEFDKIA